MDDAIDPAGVHKRIVLRTISGSGTVTQNAHDCRCAWTYRRGRSGRNGVPEVPRGSRPGERRGGRQPGTPNKATASIRALAQEHSPEAIEKLMHLMRHAGRVVGKSAVSKASSSGIEWRGLVAQQAAMTNRPRCSQTSQAISSGGVRSATSPRMRAPSVMLPCPASAARPVRSGAPRSSLRSHARGTNRG